MRQLAVQRASRHYYYYYYDCAESRQSDLEVKVNNFHVNQVEALYNTCILPIFLYSSWAVTRDLLKIDDLNQWRLRKLLGIKWYHAPCVK